MEKNLGQQKGATVFELASAFELSFFLNLFSNVHKRGTTIISGRKMLSDILMFMFLLPSSAQASQPIPSWGLI